MSLDYGWDLSALDIRQLFKITVCKTTEKGSFLSLGLSLKNPSEFLCKCGDLKKFWKDELSPGCVISEVQQQKNFEHIVFHEQSPAGLHHLPAL